MNEKTHPAETLLSRAHPQATADTIFREKVQLRPLRLRPSSPDPGLKLRRRRHHDRKILSNKLHKSNKPKPLSAKQKRALCIYEIPSDQRKYSKFLPLHELWCEYFREILNLTPQRPTVDAVGYGQVLVTADYHGAILTVVRSRCVSRVGLKGIVVKDTKFSFEIITIDDRIKTVPKEHTLFRLEVPMKAQEGEQSDAVKKPLILEIHGDQFLIKAPDRASKKFKWHAKPDI